MNAPNISATNLNGNIVLFSEDTNGASGTSKIIISSAKPSMIFEYTTEKFENGIIGKTIRDYGYAVVGYSGGADSSCLLRLFAPWCKKNNIKLAALHVNHMIRGDEANSDEDFCRRNCKELGVDFYVRRADVPLYAKENGLGLEEAARKIRYSFFEEISELISGKQNGAAIVTLGSRILRTETVALNLLSIIMYELENGTK